MSHDNRLYLRVPASDACAAAIIRLGGKKTLACEVLNKTMSGYGIAVPPECIAIFPPGRILVLEIDELVVQVKVARAVEDPEEDRYLVDLERMVELEDKVLARQLQPSWFSALRSSSGQGLGGQSTLPRDVVMAIMLCCTLLAFTFLPTMNEFLKGRKKQRNTSNASAMFRFPWSWPSSARPEVPKQPAPGDAPPIPNTAVAVPGVATAPPTQPRTVAPAAN